MNDLTKTRLFALLSEYSQTVLTNELKDAYGNFEEHLNATCGSNDNTAVYRSLSVRTGIQCQFWKCSRKESSDFQKNIMRQN